MLYVLDLDGIERNNPNLELYQRLTEKCVLWIDNGPRHLGDIMDTIMAGATNITLWENLWPEMDIPSVFELTDDEVYIGIDSTIRQTPIVSYLTKDIGIVVFNHINQTTDEFTSTSYLKDLAIKHKVYLYVPSLDTHAQWESRGVTGLIIDLMKKEGKKDGH